MDQVNAILALKSLDLLSQRLDVVANNIANANSIGFQPRRVSFEAALKQAAEHGPREIEGLRVEPQVEGADLSQGVRLDLELADAAATGRRYSAVLEVLSRQIQLEHLVANGGR